MGLKLIKEYYDGDFETIVESVTENGRKNLYISGVFLQAGIRNRNGRIYPVSLMEREVDKYVRDYVKEDRALGEFGHPGNPSINPERISHLVTELKQDGKNFNGKARILQSQPFGRQAAGLIEDGVKLGVSSRGVGTLSEDKSTGALIVQDNYRLTVAADIVADPSAPDAFVQGIMEGREWIWDNGILKEVELNAAKATIDETVRGTFDVSKRRQVFEQIFLSTLRNS